MLNIKLNELSQFLIALCVIVVVFAGYMLADRCSVLSDRITLLEKENTELYTIINAELLSGSDEKIKAYKEHIIRKYAAEPKEDF